MTPERPTVAVFGGGKGGSGRSTLCVEIARSLARLGQRVLCVDASWGCPTLNSFLNLPEPGFPAPDIPALGEPDAHLADFIHETPNKNIWLVSLSPSRDYPFSRPRFHALEIINQLHELDFDWVLVDLAPGLDPLDIGLFTHSDVPVLVCSPEPASVRVTTQFIRAVIYQALSEHPKAHAANNALLELLYDQPLDFNRETLLATVPQHRELHRAITETLEKLELYLIVNLVREGAERDMGFVLSHAWHTELGVFPRFVTPVDYEDRRWFYNRRNAGLTSSRGDEALSNDIEQLVRHLVNIDALDQQYPRPVPTDESAHTALLLGMNVDANPNHVRQHCRRLWEGYRREATVALAFREPARREHMADKIERLYRRSLSLPGETTEARAALGASTPSRTSPPPAPLDAAKASPPPNTPPSNTKPPALPSTGRARPEISPGRLVERLRRQNKISLHELSQRTHIGLKYLTAIEDGDINILPRPVYLRGYLREIAKIFGADPDELVSEYFRLLDAINAPGNE